MKSNDCRGKLAKLAGELDSQGQVNYFLCLDKQRIALNPYLNQTIQLQFTGEQFCIQCDRKIKKGFQQGYCYPCYLRLQECNLCLIHPERCRVEEGNCPKDDWAHSQCYGEHIIYLANASALKVGITRASNTPTRWIDQGARQALPVFKVNNRYQAGIIEVVFKAVVADKTHWRAMLKNTTTDLDLLAERDRLLDLIQAQLKPIQQKYTNQIQYLAEAQPLNIDYPVLQYPEKVTSLNFDKQPEIHGRLQGIKGQYLILDTGVINIRKFGGYRVQFIPQQDASA